MKSLNNLHCLPLKKDCLYIQILIILFQFVCFQLDAWISDTFKTYLMALALHLVVEAPFGNLTRQMFGRG